MAPKQLIDMRAGFTEEEIDALRQRNLLSELDGVWEHITTSVTWSKQFKNWARATVYVVRGAHRTVRAWFAPDGAALELVAWLLILVVLMLGPLGVWCERIALALWAKRRAKRVARELVSRGGEQ